MNFLNGKKTYLTGFGGLLIAVGSFLTGQVELGAAIQIAITAITAMTLKHGQQTGE